MTRTMMAALGCLLLIAAPARATTNPAPLPFLQSWSDKGQITVDDDWSGVPGVAGYRGDGLVADPGTDPRTVTADGSGTPLDVGANRTDPRAVGLAAGVAEFELTDPVVAIQGSATASAPHLLMSLDTRGRAGVMLRLALRDIDATANDAVEPVAVQYRVGAAGAFAPVAGGYVADATSGPGEATQVTRVSLNLPAAVDGQPLVQVRVITTNAAGQDEWVGIDDIEVTAASLTGGGTCPGPAPPPSPSPPPSPAPAPGPGPWPHPLPPGPNPPAMIGPELTNLELSPDTFTPARRGPAVLRRGRAGAALRFRLSRAALVRFEVLQAGATPADFPPKPGGSDGSFAPGTGASGGRVRAARGRGRPRRTHIGAAGGALPDRPPGPGGLAVRAAP